MISTHSLCNRGLWDLHLGGDVVLSEYFEAVRGSADDILDGAGERGSLAGEDRAVEPSKGLRVLGGHTVCGLIAVGDGNEGTVRDFWTAFGETDGSGGPIMWRPMLHTHGRAGRPFVDVASFWRTT